MKKTIAIILFITTALSLVACGNAAIKTDSSGYTDPKAFLEAMAKGINNRLANIDDEKHTNDTDEQLAEYYIYLVNCELEQIEKFETAIFEDSRFNDLAHHYIHACQMQLTAAENIKNPQIFNSLWSGGAQVRSGIIVIMYEQYNLPIDSNAVANYLGNTYSYQVSISTDNQSSGNSSNTPGEKNIEIDVTKGNNTIINEGGLVITFDGIIRKNQKYLVGLTFDNTTGKDLYIDMSNLKLDRTSISIGNSAVELLDDTLYIVGPHFNFVFDQEDITSNKINKITFTLDIWSGGWYDEPYATLKITIIANISL